MSDAQARRRLIAEPGDLVYYFSTEWTVQSVEGRVALVSRHNDPDNTIKVPLAAISPPFTKAADR